MEGSAVSEESSPDNDALLLTREVRCRANGRGGRWAVGTGSVCFTVVTIGMEDLRRLEELHRFACLSRPEPEASRTQKPYRPPVSAYLKF